MLPLPALTLNLCVQIEFNFVSMGKITTVNVSERYINDLCIFVRFFLIKRYSWLHRDSWQQYLEVYIMTWLISAQSLLKIFLVILCNVLIHCPPFCPILQISWWRWWPRNFLSLVITWISLRFCEVRVAQSLVVCVWFWEKLVFLFFLFPFRILTWVTRLLAQVELELLTLPVQLGSRSILIKSVLFIFIFLCSHLSLFVDISFYILTTSWFYSGWKPFARISIFCWIIPAKPAYGVYLSVDWIFQCLWFILCLLL